MKTTMSFTQRAHDLIAWWNGLTEEEQQTAFQDYELRKMVEGAHLWLRMEQAQK
ncbi:hypothetical protein [Bacillus phage vB_BceS-M2]|nr:hypothetical protein PBC5_051 [Bacillus phage PBC5]